MVSSTKKKPIGVGIVGLSAKRGWAANAHVPALRALNDYELRALSATSHETASAAGLAHFVPLTFADARELAHRDEVDLVVITVKVPYHYELVKIALEAGKMVYCEWPLGNGLKQAEELAALARSRGVRTVVGLQGRSAPFARYLHDLVADGYVGEVLSMTMVASAGGWGAVVDSSFRRYLLDAANGATMLTISVGHTLDTIESILGDVHEVEAVVATRRSTVRDAETGETLRMTAPDQVVLAGRLASGAVANIHYRGGRSRGINFYWEINGTEGDLVISGDEGTWWSSPVEIRGARGADRDLNLLEVPSSYHRVPGLAAQPDVPGYGVAHVYEQLLDDIETGKASLPNFDDAVRLHRLLDSIETAADSGRRQTV